MLRIIKIKIQQTQAQYNLKSYVTCARYVTSRHANVYTHHVGFKVEELELLLYYTSVRRAL